VVTSTVSRQLPRMRFFVSCLRLTVHSFAYLNFGGVRYLVLTFDLTFLIFDCNSQEGIHFSLLFKGSAIYIWKQNVPNSASHVQYCRGNPGGMGNQHCGDRGRDKQ